MKRNARIKRRDKPRVYIISRVRRNKGQTEVRLVTHDKNLLALNGWHTVEEVEALGYRKLAKPANLGRLRRARMVRLSQAAIK